MELGEMSPSPDAVAAFMQQLGISQVEEVNFGWIADVGLQSPLPPRWTSHTDTETGFVYYVDHDRQASSWENPLVPFLRRVVELGRAYLAQPTETFFEEQKGLLWHQHKQELDCWHGPLTDSEGRKYFVNAIAGVSSWQDPRIDAQYIFELESGLLTSLEGVLPPVEPDTPGFGPEENTPWQTSDGAEVLTLEDSSPPGTAGVPPGTAGSRRQRRVEKKASMVLAGLARRDAKEEHKSTFDKMASAAECMRDIRLEDEEVQRLQLARKVEERKKRIAAAKRAAASSSAAVGNDDCPQPPGPAGLPPPPPLEQQEPGADVAVELRSASNRSPPLLLAEGGGFAPPALPPSPHAGTTKPQLAPELERRKRQARADSKSRGRAPAKPPGKRPPAKPPDKTKEAQEVEEPSSEAAPAAFTNLSLGEGVAA